MVRQPGDPKVCNRCGRTGSHAFRRTSDGLYECTTTTACRARARRQSGARQAGRGRLPKQHGQMAPGPGVAYVIGPDSIERDLVARTMHEITGLAVAVGAPDRQTLTALGSRNVKLIAVAGECLEPIGFRNEFALRLRGSRLGGVPIFLYGRDELVQAAARRMPSARPLEIQRPAELGPGIRRQLERLEAGIA